jgi:hypothetical protein
MRLPGLAPYDAVRENGTVALLSAQRIRLYNRLALQRELLLGVYQHWFDDIEALDAFRHRFDYSSSAGAFKGRSDGAERRGAQRISHAAGRTDQPRGLVDPQAGSSRAAGQAILAGARDETELTRLMVTHGNTVVVDPSLPAAR